MKVPAHVVLITACVSAAIVESEKSAIDGGLQDLVEQSACLVLDIRKRLIGNSENIKEKLALTSKQKKELEESLQMFKRKSSDDVQPAESIEEVNTRIGVIDELFQGDIISTSEQLNQFAMDMNESRLKRQAYRNETHPGKWKYGLKYEFDEKFSKRAKSAFRKAAKLWMTNTCIDLKEEFSKETENDTDGQRSQQIEQEFEDNGDYDYDEDYDVQIEEPEGNADALIMVGEEEDIVIFVGNIKGCSSSLGRTPYYKKGSQHVQVISLDEQCETVWKRLQRVIQYYHKHRIGIAAHEIGHALGFYHTHSRHDRDEFITIVTENINTNYSDNFAKQRSETNDNYGLPYDYGSVMHYGATTGALVKGKLTMVPKDVLYTQTLGSPIISFYDLLMMNIHYNCTEACKYYSTSCENGGFAHPRNCSRCICPSGYGGDLCDQRPSGCGEVLNATTDWKKLVADHPRNMTTGTQDGYKRCHYWITAPPGTKVEVKIAEIPDGVAVDGCIYAGVEIKTHPDQRRTGYRFCSKDDVNTTLISNSSTVPIMTYMRRRRNHTDTVLEYRYIEGELNASEELEG